MAAITASTTAARTPPFSSARRPAAVVPAGEVTVRVLRGGFDEPALDAAFEKGVLKVTLPKPEEAKQNRRRIDELACCKIDELRGHLHRIIQRALQRRSGAGIRGVRDPHLAAAIDEVQARAGRAEVALQRRITGHGVPEVVVAHQVVCEHR